MEQPETTAPPAQDAQAAALQTILDALRGLRFGSVTVTVQDGVIIQVERLEKKRVGRASRRATRV
jgi:hypothetical protein